jgi:hypothetical protein
MPKLRWLVAGFPRRRPGFDPSSGHVRFVVDKVALGQFFFQYFGFPYQFSFHRLLHICYLSFGPGTIGQTVADLPNGLILTPPQETKRKENYKVIIPKALTPGVPFLVRTGLSTPLWNSFNIIYIFSELRFRIRIHVSWSSCVWVDEFNFLLFMK